MIRHSLIVLTLAACTPAATATPAATPTALLGLWTPTLLARLAREADARPAGAVDLHPAPDAERDGAIRSTYGERCHLERTCGPLWGIGCQAAVDGPYYYVRPRADHVERITVCGGACMGGRCVDCPPRDKGWTCATY